MSNINWDFILEQETDHFQRIQLNDNLDSEEDRILTEDALGSGVMVMDAESNGIEQITLENSSTATVNQNIQLEEQRDDNDTLIEQTSNGQFIRVGTNQKFLVATVDSGGAHTILLDGTTVGDSILIEDGGTDGSGTNAGDEILLDGTTSGGADANDKVLQSSVDEGGALITEDEPLISDNHVRKDYLVLNEASGRKQVFTEGGWLDEARATTEKKRIIQ